MSCMTSRFDLDTGSVFLSGQPSSQPTLDKDGQPTKILHLATVLSRTGPKLDKTCLRSDEDGIVRTKTAEEVRRAPQST